MVKNIEPKLKKIGDYLKLENEAFFTIPEYQRAYSWGVGNCDKLWQDITSFIDSESRDRYFFGTIIINCQEEDTKFALIDGQQRTTTFILLLKALLIGVNRAINKTDKDEESESLCRGLKERRRTIIGILYKAETEDITDEPDLKKDGEICNNFALLENFSINELYKSELGTILKTVNYEDIEKNVVKIPYKQKDNKYTNFFRNFKYFYEKVSALEASELNRLAKAFTEMCEVIEIKSWQVEQAITMFNSLNSDGLPLYDADIIAAQLYSYAEKKGMRDEFATSWGNLLAQVNVLNGRKIASIDSLFMQHMYYERAKEKNTDVSTPGVRRYFTDLNKKILEDPKRLSDNMLNTAEIWKEISTYPVMQVLFKFNENSKLFLASYFYRYNEDDISEDKINTVCECMLRLFTILELVDTGYSSSKFKSFLFKENVFLVDSNISENKIKSDFDEHIRNNWTREEIEEEIMDCTKNSLVYLNEYLFAKDNKIDFKLDYKYDIEHIMPDSGKNLQEIRKDANIDDVEEFNGIVNKIGNKILLEEKINRSIGNEWFRTKVSTKLEDKTGYIDSVYPIARSLVATYKDSNRPYWTKEDINAATEKARDRIVNFIFNEK